MIAEIGIIRGSLDALQKLLPVLNDDDYLQARHLLRIIRNSLERVEREAY